MRRARDTLEAADGLLLAPVGPGGVWRAFRDLRAGVSGAGGDGARATFLTALAADGSIAADATAATVLVLGYHVD